MLSIDAGWHKERQIGSFRREEARKPGKCLRLPQRGLQLLEEVERKLGEQERREVSTWVQQAEGAREHIGVHVEGSRGQKEKGAEESDSRIWNQFTNK